MSLREVYDSARNDERPGGEFDWFGVDSRGRVAVFCTAGWGLVPKCVFDVPYESFEALTDYVEHVAGPGPWQNFALYDRCRLLAYDWGDSLSGTYKRVVLPQKALLLEDLPIHLRSVANAVRFGIDFEQTEIVYEGDLPLP